MPKNIKYICATLVIFCVPFVRTKWVWAADITPPSTTYTKAPSSPDGKAGWYVSPVQFNLQATDLESGVKEINYQIDSGAWQKITFSNTLNLAPNPSFETAGSTSSGLDSWEATLVDANTVYSQDTANYVPNFQNSSAKIITTGTGWHGINNKNYFSVSTAYDNMTAAAWLKTTGVTGTAYFKVYAITQDVNGNQTFSLISQSSTLTGTTAWSKLSLNFVVNSANVVGVYLDIGLDGPGTIWADAVTISTAALPTTTTFSVGSDSTSHTVDWYSVDFAGNTETYSCSGAVKNCVTFKLDATPPGNWNDSGAFRGLFGSASQLYVYTNVQDSISGISTFTDNYTYKIDAHPEFGRYSDFLSCSSTWQPDYHVILISPPFFPGVHSAYLLTPKTDFCNTNWKICKIVRFYSEDLAGNSATKDFCINGPWVKVRGGALVRANETIDMLSEANGDNTDGIIESGGTNINFFTSTKDWKVKDSPMPNTLFYDDFSNQIPNKSTINNGKLVANTGKYKINSNFTINSGAIPSGYTTGTFDQIVFINGNLTIDTNITVENSSTALFIVKGDVNIGKGVTQVSIGILADGDFNTAYDVVEGDATTTLNLNGIYSMDKINFQRTLQGTDNSASPSENFVYEPKYLIQQADFFGTTSVKWQSVQ